MSENLIPDPPLKDLPVLPEDMRWRISAPRSAEKDETDPVRRVFLERRVSVKKFFGTKTKWVPVEWSVWRVKEGLGDFSKAWPDGDGLANTTSYLLHCAAKGGMETPRLRHAGVHGVSKF